MAKRPRAALSTINIDELYADEINMLQKELKIIGNEKIHIIYSNNDFEPILHIIDNIIVGLTNKRIFKLEKGGVWSTYFIDIDTIEHQKNNIFTWDTIICNTYDKSQYTYGVYYSDACKYMISCIHMYTKQIYIAKIQTMHIDTKQKILSNGNNTSIYILKLDQNKYYIGKTKHIDWRLDSHFDGDGSEWTKTYKPIYIIQIIPDCDVYDEDKYTIKYMEKHGVDNVRGGTFCQMKLDKNDILTIQKMIRGANDKCYKCNQSGHFANECIINNIIGKSNTDHNISVDKPLFTQKHDKINPTKYKQYVKSNEGKCYKCNKHGHWGKNCKYDQ